MLSTNTIDNVLLIANTSLSKSETCIQALNNQCSPPIFFNYEKKNLNTCDTIQAVHAYKKNGIDVYIDRHVVYDIK